MVETEKMMLHCKIKNSSNSTSKKNLRKEKEGRGGAGDETTGMIQQGNSKNGSARKTQPE